MKKQLFIALITLVPFGKNIHAQWAPIKGTNKSSVLCMASTGSELFAGTMDKGILSSIDNGITWKLSNKGLQKGKCNNIEAIVAKKEGVFSVGCSGIFSSTDNGATWKEGNINYTTLLIQSIASKGSMMIVGGYGDGIFISKDNGKTWKKSNNGLTDKFVTSVAFGENAIFAGTNKGGFFISTDNGESWVTSNTGLPVAKSVKSLYVVGNTIYAGTDGGGVNIFSTAPEGDGVYVSTDNGATWAAANKGIEKKTVQFISGSGDHVFAVLKSGKLFYYNSKAQAWTEVINDFPKETYVNTVFMKGTNVYVGTNNGIFLNNTLIIK
ncbi:MAG: hypothetical protein Q8M29_09245 [Bacteroidota bacterium]|nr:hypothetical protein [Bacteroidota bacterium]